jgi:hypothetical protein
MTATFSFFMVSVSVEAGQNAAAETTPWVNTVGHR